MQRSRARRSASKMAFWCALSAAALAPLATPAHAVPTFQITSSAVPSGQTLVVGALASDLADLYGYQITLHFDPTRVRFVSAREGPFLARGGPTFFDGGTADNAAGTVSFVFDTLIGAVPGVSGSGELASFAFATLQSGVAAFSLSDVLALDSTLGEIGVQTGSTVAAIPEPSTGGLWVLGAIAVLAARMRRARGPQRSLI